MVESQNRKPEQANAPLPIFALPQTTRPFLILAIILPIFAIAPLFYPGYFQTHNGFVSLWNVIDLRQNLGNMSWLPHIATSFNPLRSAGLLPYYAAALLPVSPIVAVKMVMGGSWLLGATGIFLWLRSWLGNAGALIAALIYTYLPYQIVMVYVRGAWGETLFWGLFPWAILATTFLVTSPRWSLVPIAAGFWLLLGFSQLGLTWWAFIFLSLLLLIVHRPQAKLPLLAAAAGTLVVTIILLSLSPLPPPSLPFTEHFLYPFQLFSAFWGFGLSTSDWQDGLSLQVGLAPLGLAMLAIFLWQWRLGPSIPPPTDPRLMFFSLAALILILVQLGLATFMWNIPFWPGHPIAETLTYPWQLLGLTGLCLAVLAGAAVWLDEQLTRLPLFAALLIFIIFSSYSYLQPQFIQAEAYLDQPRYELGHKQLLLLDHNFFVLSSGHTAGLTQGEITIPLALSGPLTADSILQLDVVWQPLRPLTEDFKVFVHLVDSQDNVLAQFDGQPRQGSKPTSGWIPGELIADTYTLTLPGALPPGPYRAFIGLYDEATLARLPVPTDTDGRVILNVE